MKSIRFTKEEDAALIEVAESGCVTSDIPDAMEARGHLKRGVYAYTRRARILGTELVSPRYFRPGESELFSKVWVEGMDLEDIPIFMEAQGFPRRKKRAYRDHASNLLLTRPDFARKRK